MTREEKRRNKYPDTPYFHYYNANPKGRITGDCAIRAICTACEVPYNQVVMDLAAIQCETGYESTTTQCLAILLKKYGWTKMPQVRKADNTKLTGIDFCNYVTDLHIDNVPIKRVIMNIGGHHMSCIINNKVWDIWNCTGGCVGNYWVKI